MFRIITTSLLLFALIQASVYGQSRQTSGGRPSHRHSSHHTAGHHGHRGSVYPHFPHHGVRYFPKTAAWPKTTAWTVWPYHVQPYGNPYFAANVHAFANLTRSNALANRQNAKALLELESVRRARMENDVDALLARQERKRINRESRFGDVYRRAAERKQNQQFAESLTSSVMSMDTAPVDPATGQIRWPMVLLTTHYDRARFPLDQLFEQRARNGRVPREHLTSMQAWIGKIQDELKTRATSLDDDVELAVSFLDELILLARQTAPSNAAAPSRTSTQSVQLAAN